MRARRGISLFEAIAALAIVGVTAVSALEAVAAEMRTAERARRALVVEALATERQVFIFLLTDRDLLNLPDSVAAGQFEWPMNEYQWTTTSTPSSSYAGLYDINVTVTWPEGTGVGMYSTTAAQYRRPVVSTRSR
jgi:type II secretory pathway pseudopilin PulG